MPAALDPVESMRAEVTAAIAKASSQQLKDVQAALKGRGETAPDPQHDEQRNKSFKSTYGSSLIDKFTPKPVTKAAVAKKEDD
jgi:hypothetical protein